jgi:CelD/BcsL family acetyltransferase involved in cellulose biosynthesis
MNAAIPIEVAAGVSAEAVPLLEIPSSWDKAWQQLANATAEPNPFAEAWFMRPAIQHMGASPQDRMIAVWRGSDLLGMLPVTTARRYGRMPIHHVENWLHYHSFYGAPLIRKGDETAFWNAALAQLDGAPWAPNFFHMVGLDPSGGALTSLGAARRSDIVHRSERAMLKSTLDPDTYFATHVRQKKRKELRRLRSRLDELGAVQFETLSTDAPIDSWIADFLALEASGWKGRSGSALNDSDHTRAFFTEALTGAHAAGKLEMLKLTLDGKPLAMLVNFMTPPGCFAFKIAFDEDYARFSPGVLIKIENLKILNRRDIEWTDSCAVEDHPMINSLWAERREIVRVTVPLAGRTRHLMFHAARSAEQLSATLRGRR